MKHFRLILIVTVSAGLLSLCAWRLAIWSGQGALESAMTSLAPLSDIFQAALGATVARGDVRFKAGKRSEGVLEYYQKNPERVDIDKRYFRTWQTALAIGHLMSTKRHKVDHWTASEDLPWIPTSDRNDAWGHYFCIKSDLDAVIVLSAGSDAVASIDCRTLQLSAHDVRGGPYGRLNRHRSGVLVLIARHAALDSTP